jgi:hypothetical protein
MDSKEALLGSDTYFGRNKRRIVEHQAQFWKKDVYRVTLANGLELDASYDHRVLTYDRDSLSYVWCEQAQLTAGKDVVYQVGADFPDSYTWADFYTDYFDLPSAMTRELSELLAYIVLGYIEVTPTGLVYRAHEKVGAPVTNQYMEALVSAGLRPRASTRSRSMLVDLLSFLEMLGVDTSTPYAGMARIPSSILQSPREYVISFYEVIAACTGRPSLDPEHNRVEVVVQLVFEQAAKDLQHLMLRAGYLSNQELLVHIRLYQCSYQ